MENYVFDDESKAEELAEQSEDTEDAFMQGYEKDEETDECAECGVAVSKEKKVVKAIEDDEYAFCSKDCAKEFEDSLN